jgi:hypothetical protein
MHPKEWTEKHDTGIYSVFFDRDQYPARIAAISGRSDRECRSGG